ncbi:MurR/RpiR family transcriptional regulator [Fulvimarina sp. 2208YS6-2-32]|uniref:MurR/RpiR family transcriptional regulator n=1 Tax=Fulvimarina uroteuthidis TaxID=3098149 RepID=A0ABU5I1B6_9HYPH|nr:MurR/RpiR family transcriptional regulator [Fulvimarina sp. 2208YS6-2-32]MDY8109170.1 MurR/RpiR family transcriptional regulator [Fulvimarina sp. 2208YS6-2-32]
MDERGDGASQPPQTVDALIEALDRRGERLPKRLKQCATFLRANLHLVAVSTIADLAKDAGVPASAFIRFCQALGFSGFSQMQALFRADYAQSRPDYTERLSRLGAEGATRAGHLASQFAEAGVRSLIDLSNGIDSRQLQSAAETLAGARTIHLIGLRRAFAVVVYLAYLFDKMGVASMLHQSSGQIDSVHAMGRDDALLAVTFAPFSQETLDLAAKAKARGVPVLALSDTTACPLADFADILMVAREVEVAGLRSPSAAMALATSLAVAVGGLRKENALTARERSQ